MTVGSLLSVCLFAVEFCVFLFYIVGYVVACLWLLLHLVCLRAGWVVLLLLFEDGCLHRFWVCLCYCAAMCLRSSCGL